jgi:hypothetical protein
MKNPYRDDGNINWPGGSPSMRFNKEKLNYQSLEITEAGLGRVRKR